MSLSGLPTDTIHLPFVAGLNLKQQAQALDPPGLSRALNVEFDEVGGLRLRKPYASIGSNIYGGGTLSGVRKIAVVGDELLCFTSTTLYSWSEALTAWVSKGTHLAVAVTETPRFANSSDQVFADRAQVGSTIAYVWSEIQAGGTELAYFAAVDSVTGAVLVAPTSFGSSRTRPRVVAGASKILVFWIKTGTGLEVTSVTPSSPSFTTTGATLVHANEGKYDVLYSSTLAKMVGAVAAAGGGSYRAFTVTEGLTVATVNKSYVANGIAVATVSTHIQVVRWSLAATNIVADLLDSSLADVNVGTVIAATAIDIDQLTCAFRSVTDGGYYRCYVFWTTAEATDATDWSLNYNWINTNNATSAEAVFLKRQGPVSRAFDYNGEIYLWSAFASAVGTGTGGLEAQAQNTAYLYRDDGFFVAKAAYQRSGGFGYFTNHLPGVAALSSTSFAWCAVERSVFELATTTFSQTYGDRGPRDVVFTFDSDDARRVVKLGATAYVSGSPILQYDGEGLTEVGFEQYPWSFSGTPAGAGGAMTAGSVSYKMTFRWPNARGESERSASVPTTTDTVVANDKNNFTYTYLHVTRKTGTRRNVAVEFWRTAINPTTDSPYYLITSRDPAATSDNSYEENVPTSASGSFSDILADSSIATKEEHPESDGTIPRIAPPAATILLASDVRLFLAGVAGEPYRVWYSLLRGDGEIAGFNSSLSFEVPTDTGAITGLGLLNETLVVFTASAVYAMPGDGYSNVVGGGTNYGPPRLISSDAGALSHDTIALTPMGLVFFSRKGWYRLNAGQSLEYIGAKVEDYNTDTWVAAQVVESQHQIRVLSTSRILMFDYLVGEWSEWSQSGGKALARWRTYPMLLDSAVKKEQSTISGVDYLMDVETGWIKPGGMQGFARIRRIMVLGEYKAAHKQRVRISYDYGSSATDDASMSFSGLAATAPTQFRQGPSRQRLEAIKIRITIYDTDGTSTPSTDRVTLTGLAIEVGLRRGLYPRLPAAQKQ